MHEITENKYKSYLLFLNQNVCCGTQNTSLKLRGRVIITIIHSSGPMYLAHVNFCENFIFVNGVKRCICDVKSSRLGHDFYLILYTTE